MTLRLQPVLENHGFDASAAPEWLLLCRGDSMPFYVVGGTGLTAIARAPAIAEATIEEMLMPAQPTWRILRIKGKTPGRTFVELRRENQLLKILEVVVAALITLKVSFHFVSDSAGHRTNRRPEELEEMLFWLNEIFTPQTNITFQKRNHFLLKSERNLGDAVGFNTDYRGRPIEGHDWERVTSKRDPSAHINVFFVWRNELVLKNQQGKLERREAIGYVVGDGRDCLVEDWNGQMDRDNDGQWDVGNPIWENARMLAHEIGHILGVSDVLKTKRIRNPATGILEERAVNQHYVMGSGPFIPKHHALVMTAVAKQIAGRS